MRGSFTVDDAMVLEVVALCFVGQNLLCSVKDRLIGARNVQVGGKQCMCMTFYLAQLAFVRGLLRCSNGNMLHSIIGWQRLCLEFG